MADVARQVGSGRAGLRLLDMTDANLPPDYQPPPTRQDYAEVCEADAETQEYFQRLRDQSPEVLAARAFDVAEDLGDPYLEAKERAEKVERDLEQATVAKNRPTTSQQVDPKREQRQDESPESGRSKRVKRSRGRER